MVGPSPSPSPTPITEDPIELEPKFDAVLRVRENDGGGGLIQVDLARALSPIEQAGLERLALKRGITVGKPSPIQFPANYDAVDVVRQLEKMLRGRSFSRFLIYWEAPGKESQKMTTMLPTP